MSQFMSSRSATSIDWQQHFTSLADAIERLQQGAETTLSSFAGEQSDFIRFNSGKVRQIGSVSQGKLTLRLIDGARQAYSTLTVCGDLQQDLDDVSAALATLRESLRGAADDPHLLFDTSQWQRATQRSGKLPEPGGLLRTVAECAQGLDFVGFYAGGTIVRGFASTSGSRGWYEVDNFNFSWSLYDPSGRAIKTTYAGDDWSDAVFATQGRTGRHASRRAGAHAAHVGAGTLSLVSGAGGARGIARRDGMERFLRTCPGEFAQRVVQAACGRNRSRPARHDQRRSESRHYTRLQRRRLPARKRPVDPGRPQCRTPDQCTQRA